MPIRIQACQSSAAGHARVVSAMLPVKMPDKSNPNAPRGTVKSAGCLVPTVMWVNGMLTPQLWNRGPEMGAQAAQAQHAQRWAEGAL